jgi:hypothetical protein
MKNRRPPSHLAFFGALGLLYAIAVLMLLAAILYVVILTTTGTVGR